MYEKDKSAGFVIEITSVDYEQVAVTITVNEIELVTLFGLKR